eukprot:3852418-Pleurochrysis_carterae.AAC.1
MRTFRLMYSLGKWASDAQGRARVCVSAAARAWPEKPSVPPSTSGMTVVRSGLRGNAECMYSKNSFSARRERAKRGGSAQRRVELFRNEEAAVRKEGSEHFREGTTLNGLCAGISKTGTST